LPDESPSCRDSAQGALGSEDTRAEAGELIRSLIEAIVLVPVDGALKAALAGILELCSANKTPSRFSPEGL